MPQTVQALKAYLTEHGEVGWERLRVKADLQAFVEKSRSNNSAEAVAKPSTKKKAKKGKKSDTDVDRTEQGNSSSSSGGGNPGRNGRSWTSAVTDLFRSDDNNKDEDEDDNEDEDESHDKAPASSKKKKQQKKGKGTMQASAAAAAAGPYVSRLAAYDPFALDGCVAHNSKDETFVPFVSGAGGSLRCRSLPRRHNDSLLHEQAKYVLETQKLVFAMHQMEVWLAKTDTYATKHKRTIEKYIQYNPETAAWIGEHMKILGDILTIVHDDLHSCSLRDVATDALDTSTGLGKMDGDPLAGVTTQQLYLSNGDLDRFAFRGCGNMDGVIRGIHTVFIPQLDQLNEILAAMIENRDIKGKAVQHTVRKQTWTQLFGEMTTAKWMKETFIAGVEFVKRLASKLWTLCTIRNLTMVTAAGTMIWIGAVYGGLASGALIVSKAGAPLRASMYIAQGLCSILRTPLPGLILAIILRKTLRSMWNKKDSWAGKLARWSIGFGTGGASEMFLTVSQRLYQNAPNRDDLEQYLDKSLVDKGVSNGYLMVEIMLILGMWGITMVMADVVCPLIEVGGIAIDVAKDTEDVAAKVVQGTTGVLEATGGLFSAATDRVSAGFTAGTDALKGHIRAATAFVSATDEAKVMAASKDALTDASRIDPNFAARGAATVGQAISLMVVRLMQEGIGDSSGAFHMLDQLVRGHGDRLIELAKYFCYLGVPMFTMWHLGQPAMLEYTDEIPTEFRNMKPASPAELTRILELHTFRKPLEAKQQEERAEFLHDDLGYSGSNVQAYFQFDPTTTTTTTTTATPTAPPPSYKDASSSSFSSSSSIPNLAKVSQQLATISLSNTPVTHTNHSSSKKKSKNKSSKKKNKKDKDRTV